MMTRRLIATAALLAAAGLGAPAHAQQNIRLTAAAGHPPVFLWVKLVDEFFIPEVDKRLAAAGKHKIEWTRAWGGTLIKLGAESKGIGDGVADLGFVSTIFEAAKFPTQNVSYYAPFGTDDIGVVTQVVNELQVSGVQMPPNWLQHVQKLLADPLLKQVRNGQLIVRGQQVELQGEVASEALRQDVAQSLSQQLNGAYSLKNALRVGSTEQGQLDQVLAGRIVEFEPGSAVLRPQGMALLDEIGSVLQSVQGKRVQIVGHTDGQGERASNITLSLARADAVRQYLVQKHRLPAQQLSIDGVGPDQPVASNATEEGRARNRRIEFRAGI